jgi:hypothetical protein
MRILQKELQLVPGQEIHKVPCLAMLEYFKKLMGWYVLTFSCSRGAAVEGIEDETF